MKRDISKKICFGAVAVMASITLATYCPTVYARDITEDTVLSEDISDGIHVPKGANVTIDLNGHSVTGVEHTSDSSSANSAAIVNEGTLKITGNGSVLGPDTYAVLNRSGNITILGGEYTNTGVAKVKYTWSGPSLIVNGWYDGSQNPDGNEYSEMTINGGTFIGGLNNVKNDEYGILTINDGEFKESPNNVCVLTGGKSITITGGTFDHSIYTQSMGADKEKAFMISGGTFLDAAQLVVNQSGAQADVVYKDFVVKDVDIYKIGIAAVNIDNLRIENVNLTINKKITPLSVAAGNNVVIDNVKVLNTLKESTINIKGNLEVNNSVFPALYIYGGVSAKLNNTSISESMKAYTASTNLTILGGEYNNLLMAQQAASKTNGSTVTLNDGVLNNVTVAGAGTLNVNGGTVNNIDVKNVSNVNVSNGNINGNITVDETENSIKLSDGIYENEPNKDFVVSPKFARVMEDGKYELVEPADYTSVDEALASVGEFESQKDIYTDDSYALFESSVNNARNMVRNYSKDEQDDVNKFVSDIANTIQSLVIKDADYSVLDEVIDSIPYDLDIYTKDSVEALDSVLDSIDWSKNILEQESVDAYVTLVKTAIDDLVLLGDDVMESIPTLDEDSEDVNVGVIIDDDTESMLADSRTVALQKLIDRAVAAGNSVYTKIIADIINVSDASEEVHKDIAIVEKSISSYTKVVNYLDLSIIVKTDNVVLGNITSTAKPIKFNIAVPSELVKENRSFDVVRVHDGMLKVLDSTMKDNVISFESDLFSTYALVYTDNEVTTDEEDNTTDTKEDTTKTEEKNEETKTVDETNTEDVNAIDELDDTPKTGDITASIYAFGILILGALATLVKFRR